MAEKERKSMGKTFRGGVPYALDVNRLNEAFPVPSLTEGRVIKHPQLEAVINTPFGSQRYYAVINSWISKNKNAHGIYVIWKHTVGIEVLDPAKLLTHAEDKTREKIRQTRKAVTILAWVDRSRLDVFGQQRLDHDQRVAGALNDAMQAAKKDMAVPLAPIRSLPKRQIEPGGNNDTLPPEMEKPKNENGKDRIN